MSAENIDGAVFYEQLENLEDEFEEVELELRKFHQLHVLPRQTNQKKEGNQTNS